MTEVEGSLAALIHETHKTLSAASGGNDGGGRVGKGRGGGGGRGGGPGPGGKKGGDEPNPPLLDTTGSTRLTVLNGSFHSVSDDVHDDAKDDQDNSGKTGQHPQTVIVFPDFTFVNGVGEKRTDAEKLWRTRLAPGLGRAEKTRDSRDQDQGGEAVEDKTAGGSQFETRPLPYDSVVLLCKTQ